MSWVPLPVAIPLLAAAFFSAFGRKLPRILNDLLAIAITLLVLTADVALMLASREHPITYWFGGWKPHGNVALGIAFVIDPMVAGFAALSAVLMAGAFLFAMKYFDEVGGLFHALMLIFLAGISGLALTADLFNLFVFFELMGVSAFALCGYKSREPGSLHGAINLAVTNTIGAFLLLFGVALLYGRTGALNMAQVAGSLGRTPDGLVIVAFALITCALFVKGAIVPFHFWLPDAHAVAPTPVSVIFSGVMVEAGLLAFIRVYGFVFSRHFEPYEPRLRTLLLTFGVVTALVGAAFCALQHHLKRLLAFSTISHAGVMLIALGGLSSKSLAGAALYVVGHGLIKAALFMGAGVLLHRLGTVNELELRGRGRGRPRLAILWAVACYALAGGPPFPTFLGESLIAESEKHSGHQWLQLVSLVASVITAAAAFRAGARIFLGWGPSHEVVPPPVGEQTEPPETEPSRHTPPSMMIALTAMLLLALGIAVVPQVRHLVEESVTHSSSLEFSGSLAKAEASSEPPGAFTREVVERIFFALLSALLGAAVLWRHRLMRTRPSNNPSSLGSTLREIQSGHVGDYVAWLLLGVTALGGACLFLLGP